jgi:hypothetical protein
MTRVMPALVAALVVVLGASLVRVPIEGRLP